MTVHAEQKKLELIVDFGAEVPTGLVGDPVRLTQILTNLVGNAIKFTERGHVLIGVDTEARSEEDVVLRFFVTDTGIGIPRKHHHAIFDAFRQADGSTTRRFGGTGLGLAIVSTLVQLMGGRITVDSEPGEGSTFQFTTLFGLAESRQGAGPAASPVAGSKALHPLKVLLAEDNLVNQRVAVGLLRKRGHTVTVVNNGQEALDMLSNERFELVLMDVQMPVMGGLEATAAIRAREHPGAPRVRIVAMTAHAMIGDRERCLAAGMDAYITKPIDTKLLYSVIEEDVEATMQSPRERTPVVDRLAALQLMGGDERLLDDVIRLFLADCPARLEAIKAAVEARDADRIRREAHGLKGASGNLAATGLVDAARVLENIGAERRLDAADSAWKTLAAAAAAVLEELSEPPGPVF